MKTKYFTQFLYLCLTTTLVAEPTLEERITALEARVEALEKATSQEGASTSPSAQATAGTIFQEDFEGGLAGWEHELKYVAPPQVAAKNHPHYQVNFSDDPRAAKELTFRGDTTNPMDGKRFMTFASKEKQLVIVNNGQPDSVVDTAWRGVHIIRGKEGFTLGDSKLPVLTFSYQLRSPVIKKINHEIRGGQFEVGWSVAGSPETWTLIQSFQEDTEGWKEVELDLSALPKDKSIVLEFRYFVCDSRLATSPGVQVDAIRVFDDGE